MSASTQPTPLPSSAVLNELNLESARIYGVMRTRAETLKTHLGRLLHHHQSMGITQQHVHAVRDAYDQLNQTQRDYRHEVPKDIHRLLAIAQQALEADAVRHLDRPDHRMPERELASRPSGQDVHPTVPGWADAPSARSSSGW